MFALSSIMRRPIFSVYPKRGNPVVRKDLHRRIEPREKISNKPLYIMWTTTRQDMTNTHWVPNHFVPVLQIQDQTNKGHAEAIPADEWQEIDTHTNEKYDEPAVSSKDGIVEGIPETAKNYDDLEDKTDQESYDVNKMAHDEENMNTSENITQEKKDISNNNYQNGERTNEKNEPEVREDEIKIDNQDQAGNEIKTENSTMNLSADSAYEIPTEASECIDKCVIVNYNNNTPYLGYVEDEDSSDIFVVCMHRVYKKMEMNVFFWPTAVKDKYWYKQDQILAIIPEPKKIKGSSEHFEVDPDIWCRVLEKV